jgi:arginine/serine-rich splicing factor 7
MSTSRSRSRSARRRSRSRSKSRGRFDDGSRRYRSRSRSSERLSDEDLCRLHVADLNAQTSQHDIEKAFNKYGDLKETWMAKNPPCFAFIVFKNKDDAALALKEMDGK